MKYSRPHLPPRTSDTVALSGEQGSDVRDRARAGQEVVLTGRRGNVAGESHGTSVTIYLTIC